MAEVTIKSYRKAREAEIMGRLEKSMEKVGAIVEKRAKQNVIIQENKSPWKKTGELCTS